MLEASAFFLLAKILFDESNKIVFCPKMREKINSFRHLDLKVLVAIMSNKKTKCDD